MHLCNYSEAVTVVTKLVGPGYLSVVFYRRICTFSCLLNKDSVMNYILKLILYFKKKNKNPQSSDNVHSQLKSFL